MNAPLVVLSWVLVVALVSGAYYLVDWFKEKLKSKE